MRGFYILSSYCAVNAVAVTKKTSSGAIQNSPDVFVTAIHRRRAVNTWRSASPLRNHYQGQRQRVYSNAQFGMEGATPTQYALTCFGTDAPAFNLRAHFSLATSHYLSSQRTRRTLICGSEALILLSLILKCTRQRVTQWCSECIRLVTYLTSYQTIDWTRMLGSRCCRALDTTLRYTSSHPVLFTGHNYPLIRCRIGAGCGHLWM
jgi:hypothetical protein